MGHGEHGGAIEVSIQCFNAHDEDCGFCTVGLVDERVGPLVLPSRCLEPLGAFPKAWEDDARLGDGSTVLGVTMGPVFVRIGDFRWMATEAFVASGDNHPVGSRVTRPLIGRNALAQIPAAVDPGAGRLSAAPVYAERAVA